MRSNSSTIYIGIDPGNKGAVAFLTDDEPERRALILDLPVQVHKLKAKRADGTRREEREIDGGLLCHALFSEVCPAAPVTVHVAVEALIRKGPRPLDQRQVFNYGKTVAAVESFSEMARGRDVTLDFVRVSAAVVRAHFRLGGESYEGRKEEAVKFVAERWGRTDLVKYPPVRLKKDGTPYARQPAPEIADGRADALLIASWLRDTVRRQGGERARLRP